MRWFEVTAQERAARYYGRRATDAVSIPVRASTIIGAGIASMYMFEKVDTPSWPTSAVAVVIAAVCGACIFGTMARASRTGDPDLLRYTVVAGLVFGVVAIGFGRSAPPLEAAPPTTTVVAVDAAEQASPPVSPGAGAGGEDPQVASAGPLPAGAGSAAEPTVEEPASTSVDGPRSCDLDDAVGSNSPSDG